MNAVWDKSWVDNVGGSSFYGVLGVNRYARAADIKRGYRSKALQFHPDRNPNDARAEAMFKNVNAAYQVLSDAGSRIRYNSMLDVAARDQRLFNIITSELSNHNLQFGSEAYSVLREIYQMDGNFNRLYNSAEEPETPTQAPERFSGLVSVIKNFPWKTSAKVAASIAGLGIGYHIAMSDTLQDKVQYVPPTEIVPTCESVRMDYMNASTDVERINARHQIRQLCK